MQRRFMSTVFLALANSSHYSGVLRTRFIAELARHFRVLVLTPQLDDAIVKRDRYFRNGGVSYHRFPITYPRFWNVLDRYLRVPLVSSFDHLTYMRYFYQRSHAPIRKLLMASRRLFPAFLFTTDRLTLWEVRWAPQGKVLAELFRTHTPILVLTATPGFTPFEAEIIVAAKRLGVQTAAISINYDNLTSNGKLIRKTDYLAVWNNLMRREAKVLHRYSDERLGLVGCLRFDHYFYDEENPRFPSREDFLKAKGLDPGRKTLVFAGPTPTNYPPRREFIAELLRLKRDGHLDGDPNILVRIHPNDSLATYREFLGMPGMHFEGASRNVRLDGGKGVSMDEEDLLNLTATLKYADVVLNFASTVAMEAAIFDRPVINVAFPDYRRIVYQYEYNKHIVDTGGVRLARSPEELSELVNMYFRNPALDREARAKLLEFFIPFRDGRSWARTMDFIVKITKPGSESFSLLPGKP